MNHLRLLLVDDEEGMRMAITRAMRNFTFTMPDIEGEVTFEIQQADCGEAALEILGKEPVDILLLDHKMPGISGLDVLQQVNEKQWDCLTIMITAFASLDTAITATKRGAYDFLAKPFTPAELKSTVRKAAIHLVVQRHARRLAEEKKQVRFQLTSVIAHELKAPLGAIEGYLYLLRDRPAGNDWATYEQPIARSIIRLGGMRKMINDLLDLTRLESGQKKREFATLDLVGITKTSMETVKPEAEQRKIVVELHAPETLPLRADPNELEIVMNNLLTNAVKYNRDGGRVDVTLSRTDDGAVKIQVADTGIGMTPEEAARLFTEFVRIKNKKTRQIPGTGLGLSILKKIVQLYQGDVTVASIPDEGSTFTAWLHDAADEDQGKKADAE